MVVYGIIRTMIWITGVNISLMPVLNSQAVYLSWCIASSPVEGLPTAQYRKCVCKTIFWNWKFSEFVFPLKVFLYQLSAPTSEKNEYWKNEFSQKIESSVFVGLKMHEELTFSYLFRIYFSHLPVLYLNKNQKIISLGTLK